MAFWHFVILKDRILAAPDLKIGALPGGILQIPIGIFHRCSPKDGNLEIATLQAQIFRFEPAASMSQKPSPTGVWKLQKW